MRSLQNYANFAKLPIQNCFYKILRNKTPIASERFSTIWAINIATEAAANTDADVDDAVDVDADA